MEYAVSDMDLKRLPQVSLNFIDCSISSYCYILNSPRRFEHKSKAKKLASAMCDLKYDHMKEKDEKKKRETEAEENIILKSEDNQIRENKDRLRGLESCEALAYSVLTFGMDHINKLKAKELWVILCYHFGLRRLKGSPKKVELVEAVTDLFRRDWEGLMQRVGGGGLEVKNNMEEIDRFLV